MFAEYAGMKAWLPALCAAAIATSPAMAAERN